MPLKLQNKIAVITGATSGLALATAKLFAAEGARVFITGRRQEQLDKAVAEIGPAATGVQGDAASLPDLDRLFAAVKEKAGRIDVLYASAGVGSWVPLADVTEDHYNKTFDVNVKGTLFTMQKALPLLAPGASIIMTGSVAGSKGMPSFSVYCASKAAIRSFARTWIVDLKDRKFRINVLSPGPIDTAILDGLTPDQRTQLANLTVLGRLGKPEEIAKAALFLASDDSSYITGIELFVDGGLAQI